MLVCTNYVCIVLYEKSTNYVCIVLYEKSSFHLNPAKIWLISRILVSDEIFRWCIVILYKDSSFSFNIYLPKNRVAMGDSCFSLAKILNIFAETTCPNDLLDACMWNRRSSSKIPPVYSLVKAWWRSTILFSETTSLFDSKKCIDTIM